MTTRPGRELRSAAETYLARCFSDETPPRVSELAATLGMALKQLSDAFVAEVGERPANYLKRRQVERAQELLAAGELSTTQIGYRAGFGTRASFFRAFKRLTGETPRTHQFRKKCD